MAINFPRSIYTVAEGVSLRGWSSSPADGDSNTYGGKTYTYNSTQQLWILSTGFTHSGGGKTYSWDGEKWIAQTAIPYIYHGPLTTSNKPTGLNADDAGDLYFDTTDDKMQVWSGSAWEDISVTSIGTDVVSTTSIIDDAVTYAKIQNVSTTNRVLGRDTNGAGVIEEITPAALRTMINVADGANQYVHPNHSGEVTSTADGATVITDNVVDEANLKVSNAPVDQYVLTANSNANGGLTWNSVGTLQSTSDRIESNDSQVKVVDSNSSNIQFRINNTEMMRMDYFGYVGLGTTAASGYWGDARDFVIHQKSGATAAGLSIIATDRSSIGFGDGGSSSGRRGQIVYYHKNSGTNVDVMQIKASAGVAASFLNGGIGLGDSFSGFHKTAVTRPLHFSTQSASAWSPIIFENSEGGFDLYTDNGGFYLRNGLTANGNYAQRLRINEDGTFQFGNAGNYETYNFDGGLFVSGNLNLAGAVNERGLVWDNTYNRNFIRYYSTLDSSSGGQGLKIHGKNLVWATHNSRYDRMKLLDSGVLIHGPDLTSRSVAGSPHWVQINNSGAGLSICRNSADQYGSLLSLGKNRNATPGDHSTAVVDNDYLGYIYFSGSDSTDLTTRGATIDCRVDGTPSNNNMPAELNFYTNYGTSVPTLRLTIKKDGHLHPGVDSAQDLGSSSKRWKDLYLASKLYNNASELIIDAQTSNTVNIYVSDSGDDTTGSGGSSYPYRTIEKALTKVPEINTSGTSYNIRIQGSSYDPNGGVNIRGFQGSTQQVGNDVGQIQIYADTAGCTWDLTAGSLICSSNTVQLKISRIAFKNLTTTSGAGYLHFLNCEDVTIAGDCSFETSYGSGWSYNGGVRFTKCRYVQNHMDFTFTSSSTGGNGTPVSYDACKWVYHTGNMTKAGTQHLDPAVSFYNGTHGYLDCGIDNFHKGIQLGKFHYGSETAGFLIAHGTQISNCTTGISAHAGSNLRKRSVTFTNCTTNESTEQNGFIG